MSWEYCEITISWVCVDESINSVPFNSYYESSTITYYNQKTQEEDLVEVLHQGEPAEQVLHAKQAEGWEIIEVVDRNKWQIRFEFGGEKVYRLKQKLNKSK